MFKILVLTFCTIYLLVLALYLLLNQKREHLFNRLKQISLSHTQQRKEEEDELNKPFAERVIRPMIKRASSLTGRLMPARSRKKLEQALQEAGNPWNLKAQEYQALQYALAVVCFLAGWLISGKVISGVALGIIAYLFSWTFLSMKARTRKAEIMKELPDILDLLTVSVEAGLGFDAALVKVIDKMGGVLPFELRTVIQEIRMGKARREALWDVGERLAVEDVKLFTSSINQADMLGISIGNVLRNQSNQARIRRRQRVEEQAMKAPVKMLFPLIFFIFPSIFIVLLGPAAIQIFNTLVKK
jgi:tight adherence protein C